MKRGQGLDDSRTIRRHGTQNNTVGLVRASTRVSGRASQSNLAGFCLNTAVRLGNSGSESRNLTGSISIAASTSSAQVADSSGGDTSSNGLTIRSESAEDCGHFVRCLFTVSAAPCSSSMTKMTETKAVARDEKRTVAGPEEEAVAIVDSPVIMMPDALPVLLAPPFPPADFVWIAIPAAAIM